MTAKHIQEAWDKLRQERDALTAQLATAEQRSEELAAQVEVMRDALDWVATDLGYDWLLPEFDKARDALAIPNTAAAILRQRDARTLREAACIADQWGLARKPSQGGNALRNCANHIRSIADELERKNG